MERRAAWFPLVAVVLIVVGLVTLAAPPPAHAFDPQLALALASAAGAIALITGYLIVSNSRDKQRAASFDGIHTCRDADSSGPMGCTGPSRPVAAPPAAAAEGPMGGDDRIVARTVPVPDGPMGGDGPIAARAVPMPDGPLVAIGAMPAAAEAAFQSAASPMVGEDRSATSGGSFVRGGAPACPGGVAAGPMGCGTDPLPASSVPVTSAPAPSGPQGQ